MYYVIETKDASAAGAGDMNVSETPAVTDATGSDCLYGWCGIHDGKAVFAHGEFASSELAHTFIKEQQGADNTKAAR